MSDFVLRGGTAVHPDKAPEKQDILVKGGKIAGLLAPGTPVAAGIAEQKADGLHVFPGLIDAHVHFGFGTKMLIGSLGCFVHGIFPWLCLTRGSDTIRALHHRMVTHRTAQPVAPENATAVAAGD